jgi:DNA-binding CsgD family transcriptional regulator
MELDLYDNQPLRQQAWSSVCVKYSLPIHYFHSLVQLDPIHREPRIIVFEETTIGDCVCWCESLLVQLRNDVVAFSVPRCSAPTASSLIRSGANWVFDVESNPRELEIGLRQLQRDALNLKQQLQQWEHCQRVISSLSSGERFVLDWVLRGSPNHQIAQHLSVSVRTVESRRAKVYRKCQVSNVTDLVRLVEQYERLQQRFGAEPRNLHDRTRALSMS